jgi:two-component system, OmpR family, sensor histidine kinase MprB
VNFRLRLIVATTLAVSLAVVVSCFASYLAMRNAVQGSVDSSLYSASYEASSYGQGENVAGVTFQIVTAAGTVIYSSGQILPVDQTVQDVANGQSGEVLRTIVVDSNDLRELLVPLRAGTVLQCSSRGVSYPCTLTTDEVQMFSVNITGQQHEINVLAFRLLLLALAGILLAAALGYLAAQAALRPLETVTNEIETVAETTNVSFRMEEGSNDELGRLRRVFNRLLSSVESSQRLQRQLVLDSSHELRTPLTSLRTNAQVLSRADELSADELRQISTDMIAQTDELAALISDLSELARGEGIDGPLETIRFDEIVDDCVVTARTHARTRSITVDAELEGCDVRGRRDRLAHAVSNLLNNAINFAPEGGHVLVRLRNGALVIADDGPGVADEDAPFIFDRFWRAPGARGLPGSGLGLAIVTQVAREMGGSVTVGHSVELGGAMFTLRVPVNDGDDD